jgi:hypothetical protein
MKKILSAMLIVCLMLTIGTSAMPASVNDSTPLTDNQALSIEGAGWLGGCGMAGMWGLGAILLSAGPAGWFALGMAAGLLLACATL